MSVDSPRGAIVAGRLAVVEIAAGVGLGRRHRIPFGVQVAVAVSALAGLGLALASFASSAAPLGPQATPARQVVIVAVVLVGCSGLATLYLASTPRLSLVARQLATLPASPWVRLGARGAPLAVVAAAGLLIIGPAGSRELSALLGITTGESARLIVAGVVLGGGTALLLRATLAGSGCANRLCRIATPAVWLALCAGAAKLLATAPQDLVAGVVVSVPGSAAVAVAGTVAGALAIGFGKEPARTRLAARGRRRWAAAAPLPWLRLEVLRTARVPQFRSLCLQCAAVVAAVVAVTVIDAGGTGVLVGGHAVVLVAACWAHPVLSALRWTGGAPPYGALLSDGARHARLATLGALVLSLPPVALSGAAIAWSTGDPTAARDTVLLWVFGSGLAAVAAALMRARPSQSVDVAEALALGAVYAALTASSLLLGSSGLSRTEAAVLLATGGLLLHAAAGVSPLARPTARGTQRPVPQPPDSRPEDQEIPS